MDEHLCPKQYNQGEMNLQQILILLFKNKDALKKKKLNTVVPRYNLVR